LRLDHVVVTVRDASEARAFYEDVLGLPLVSAFSGDGWGGRRWLMMVFALGTDGQHLVATAFAGLETTPPSPFPRDARHVAFATESTEAWLARKERIVARASDWWEEDHGGQRSLYVVDPSGNVLELTTPTPRIDVTSRSGAADEVARWVESNRLETHTTGGRS
jgi:catechol 2,3-dioxygenase-like lactoylglutathione lyase family enzyme